MTQLPEGYTLYEPSAQGAPQIEPKSSTDSPPGVGEYGGATVTQASDAAGAHYVACCAKHPNGDFLFSVFRKQAGAATYANVPLQMGAGGPDGRGSIDIDHYTGKLRWIAWKGSDFYQDDVPGAVPFPAQVGAAGAYIPLNPNRYNAGIDGQTVSGGHAIDVPTLYGLPVTSRAYCVRLVAQAASSNTRVRLGLETQPGQLTVNAQSAGLQLHQVGIVNAGPGGSVWLSVVDGNGANASAQAWLTIIGYWP